ncbi:MAG: Holliday junction resolvase RuvX, partial [bacterium]|nr:Holliday junction resolvase RuvX [bacterium]
SRMQTRTRSLIRSPRSTTRRLPALVYKNQKHLVGILVDQVEHEAYGIMLIGHPLNMDGSAGTAARRSEKLCESLEAVLKRRGIPAQVLLWDERLTSFEAQTRLRQRGVSLRKGRDALDSLAAEVLLEDYLGSQT